jgi:radical SAM protein (TIGR01212 family)
MNNLFTDEKHYLTLNNYLKDKYNEKVFKVSLNGNFSCPNRDGKISTKGCLFCSAKGSGDFAGDRNLSIKEQFYQITEKLKDKWPEGSYIAYFQANTNTYGTVSELKKRYDQIIKDGKLLDEKIKILSIATRPDCLDNDVLNLLSDLNKSIPLWIELGFQTSNESTANYINRGYNNECFVNAVKKLKQLGITVIVHIINGLPNETKTDMINTVKFLQNLNIDGIKIHMLHVIKNSPLGQIYLESPFPLLSLEEYVDVVVNQLRLLPPNMVIHRITGDADKNELIAPLWTLKKFVVMNEIDKKMRKENVYQGDLYV